MLFQSTGRTQIRSDKVCVLFDPLDGTIVHMHRVVTMEGADETPEPLVEQRTLQLARELGIDVEKLQVLHFDARHIEPKKRYAVDPRRRSLVELEPSMDKERMPGPSPRYRRAG